MVAGTAARPRVLVVGAGALGSVYGGFLARGGCDVQLLARAPHARAIEDAGGLLVESHGDERWLAPVRADWRPEAIAPADHVIVLTKTPDTAAALEGLDHVRDELELAVSLQNGVEKDDVLAGWCGEHAVVGGVSMVGGTLLEPGRVRNTLAGPTFLGELTGCPSARVRRLGAALEASGLPATLTDRIRSVEWTKLAVAVAAMAVSALARRYFHETFLVPELAAAQLGLMRETAAVAQAAGEEVDDWPSLSPVRSLVSMAPAQALEWMLDHGRELERAGATSVRISMLQSIERGGGTEVEAVHGYVSRTAAELGVATPAVDLCYRLLAGATRPTGEARACR